MIYSHVAQAAVTPRISRSFHETQTYTIAHFITEKQSVLASSKRGAMHNQKKMEDPERPHALQVFAHDVSNLNTLRAACDKPLAAGQFHVQP